MFSFVNESLNTIEKGKISVSLALLRKPFRDNLLYLEWLLGDSDNFIKMVSNQDIDSYAIENLKPNYKIKNIIRKAIKKIDNQDYFSIMDENLYFDIRYNYNAKNSLQLVWNKANHLVTTCPKTRSEEFNFVFLDDDLHLEFIQYYYNQIPNLLFYTYNVILELYNIFISPISNETRIYNNYIITYKYCNHLNSIKDSDYFTKEAENILNFICEQCKNIVHINLNSQEFIDFKTGYSFICPKCGSEILINKYIFLDNYKTKSNQLKLVK